MFKLSLASVSMLFATALLAKEVAAAQVVQPACNGKSPTKYITSYDQLTRGMVPHDTSVGNSYYILGTTGNDVFVFDLPTQDRYGNIPEVYVHFMGYMVNDHSRDGGSDFVCVNRAPEATFNVLGSRFLKTSGLRSTSVEYIDDRGAEVEIYGGNAVVHGGDGIDIIVIQANEDDYQLIVDAGAGSDSIYIATYDEVVVDAGDGDDVVMIDAMSSSGRALVVGGRGVDTITTGTGIDLVYASDVDYSGREYRSGRRVTNLISAYGAFQSVGIATMSAYVMPHLSGDFDGGDVDTGGGNDYIHGTSGTDYLRGGSGNDALYGYGSRDRFWGGDGSDKLYGGDGDDDVYGEKGDDFMDGGNGKDLMKGGKGDDAIVGGSGNDTLYGNEDDDEIDGDSGSDECHGDAGDDALSHCE